MKENVLVNYYLFLQKFNKYFQLKLKLEANNEEISSENMTSSLL